MAVQDRMGALLEAHWGFKTGIFSVDLRDELWNTPAAFWLSSCLLRVDFVADLSLAACAP